ncbi:MAG: D-glycerate dehydrogenase [Phycisphaerales bacterium]
MSDHAPCAPTTAGPADAPVVAVTRAVPFEPTLPGAHCKMVPGMRALPRAELLEFVRGAHAVVTWVSERVDEEFLDAAGPSLRAVCNYAVGTDNIDLAACRKRGIIVTNTPHAVTEGTANLAWALLLAVARRVVEGDHYARSPAYAREGPLAPAEFLGTDISGKSLLIVGAGRIGYATALRGIGFAMRPLYVARSRHLDFETAPLCARRVTLEDGLKEADVVSIHTPLTPETRGMFNARTIGLMKRGAILINTARGPIVEEAALADALREGRLYGAGLDVYEKEPVVHPALLPLRNCVLTPHVGSGEEKYRRIMGEMAFASARAVIEGRDVPNRVA